MHHISTLFSHEIIYSLHRHHNIIRAYVIGCMSVAYTLTHSQPISRIAVIGIPLTSQYSDGSCIMRSGGWKSAAVDSYIKVEDAGVRVGDALLWSCKAVGTGYVVVWLSDLHIGHWCRGNSIQVIVGIGAGMTAWLAEVETSLVYTGNGGTCLETLFSFISFEIKTNYPYGRKGEGRMTLKGWLDVNYPPKIYTNFIQKIPKFEQLSFTTPLDQLLLINSNPNYLQNFT